MIQQVTSISSLRATVQENKISPEIKAAAEDFESVFISQMVSHMFSGLEPDPVFGGGAGEDMFRSMMIQEYGKQMAKTGGIGVSKQIQKAILDIQEAQSKGG